MLTIFGVSQNVIWVQLVFILFITLHHCSGSDEWVNSCIVGSINIKSRHCAGDWQKGVKLFSLLLSICCTEFSETSFTVVLLLKVVHKFQSLYLVKNFHAGSEVVRHSNLH